MLKHSRNWTALLAGVIVVVALALTAPHVLAQGSPATTVELVGVITAYDPPTLFTVNGLSVDASGAQITAPLAAGLAVRVEGTPQIDGSILATEVKSADTGLMPGELEIRGTLDSLAATQAVVGGVTFDISIAEIQPGLLAGDLVKVHASLSQTTTTWIARELALFIPDQTVPSSPVDNNFSSGDDHFEIVGTLEAVNVGSIVVSGQTIDTTNAEVQGALVVGMVGKVELVQSDTSLVAREVKAATADDLEDPGQSGDNSGNSGDDNSNSGAGNSSNSNSIGSMCQFEIESSSANLRSGPGTGYDIIGFALESQKLEVVQIDATGTWIQIQLANQPQAWIALSVGKLDDCSVDSLEVSTTPFSSDNNSSVDDSGNDVGDDHGGQDDSSNSVSGDDQVDDGPSDDQVDDHGGQDDSSNSESGDDQGDDGPGHDQGDDHGGD